MGERYTTVALSWRKNRRNHRLIFGEPAGRIRLDWRRSLAVFLPHSVFGYERWRAGKYGTIDWQVFVLQAGAPGERLDDISGVRPGAKLLCSGRGKIGAKWLLSAIEHVKAERPDSLHNAVMWQQLSCFEDGRFESAASMLAVMKQP